MQKTPVSILIYSPFGGGKTSFLATAPKPLLVFFFDRFGKDIPLLKLGQVGEMLQLGVGQGYVPCREVKDMQTNELLVRIEYYHDVKELPEAYSKFLARMGTIHLEFDQWATIGLDSMTMCEFASRKWDEKILNLGHRDPRSHYAQSKNMLEELFYSRMAGFPTNVVVTAHVDEQMSEIHGQILRSPAAPGKLSSRIGAAFQEVYRLFIQRDEAGNRQRVIQTDSDGQWSAQTQLDIPMYIQPTFEALYWTYSS